MTVPAIYFGLLLAAGGLVFLFSRLPLGGFEGFARGTLAVASRVCAWLAWLADLLFRPSDRGRVNLVALVAWILFSLVAIWFSQILVWNSITNIAADMAVIVFALLAVVHLGFIAAFLLKIHEDNDVIDGSKPVEERLFKDNSAITDRRLLFSSIALVVLDMVVVVKAVDPTADELTVVHTGVPFLDYVLAVSAMLPVLHLLVDAAQKVADWSASGALSLDLPPRLIRNSIFFVGEFFLIGAVVLLLRQRREIRTLIDTLRTAKPGPELDNARFRIRRAPSLIKPLILTVAVTPGSTEEQKRAIDEAISQEIFTFTRAFCYTLSRQAFEIKKHGLERAADFAEKHGDRFDYDLLKSTLVPIVRHIRNRRLSKKIRSRLYMVLLVLLNRGHGSALSARTLTDWRDETELRMTRQFIVEAATMSDDLTYGSFEIQERAIDVGVQYQLLELPRAFVKRLGKFGKQRREEGLRKLISLCRVHARQLEAADAEKLIALIDVKIKKPNRNWDETTVGLLGNLKGTVRAGQKQVVAVEPVKPVGLSSSVFARVFHPFRRVFAPLG